MRIVTVLIAAGFVVVALPAHAGVCTKEIEMVTQLLKGGGAPSVGSVAPAAPSTGALSSAVGSGAAAGALGSAAPSVNSEASPEALAAVQQAQAADAAGDEASCMDYIGQAKELLGLVQ